ncbi:MAG: hypothetical protein LC723_06385, partial [Actinobacteria bacterium]|nr:hypothetical protein [Actinomycetota bacterium]
KGMGGVAEVLLPQEGEDVEVCQHFPFLVESFRTDAQQYVRVAFNGCVCLTIDGHKHDVVFHGVVVSHTVGLRAGTATMLFAQGTSGVVCFERLTA